MKVSLRIDTEQRRAQETGATIPLAAAIVTGLMTLFIVLAFDVNLGHQSNVLAQRLADEACLTAHTRLPFMSQALGSISSSLPHSESLRFGLKLKSVNVIAPMILEDMDNPLDVWQHPSGSWPRPFSDLGLACPTGLNPNDCLVHGDVNTLPASLVAGYPATFWDSTLHNRFVACEIEVETDTFILESKVGKGKAVYSMELANSALGGNGSVILAVAPQLLVNPTSQQFIFPAIPEVATYNPDSTPAFFKSNPELGVNYLNQLHPTYVDTSNSALPISQNNPPNTNEQRWMRRGCYNPIVAARNKLTQSLVDTLARVGQIRKTFQFMIVNNKNHPSLGQANSPTRIKGPDEDPFERQYYFPFTSELDASGNFKCGFACNSSNCTPQDLLNMSQLRHCFHLNHAGGMKTAGAENVNDSLEPLGFRSTAHMTNQTYGVDLNTWDQVQTLGANNHLSKLSDLARALGKVQSLPHDTFGTPTQTQPDIVGLLRYVRSDIQAWNKIGPVRHASHPQPGHGVVEPPRVNNFSTSLGTNTPSDVVLILTQALNPTDIVSIQTEVNNLNSAGSRILVVMFATDSSEEGVFDGSVLQDPTLSDLKTAFNATGPGSLNKVIRIRPHGTVAGCNSIYDTNAPNNATCFQQFYTDLVSPGTYSSTSEHSLEKISEVIISSFLFRKGLAL